MKCPLKWEFGFKNVADEKEKKKLIHCTFTAALNVAWEYAHCALVRSSGERGARAPQLLWPGRFCFPAMLLQTICGRVAVPLLSASCCTPAESQVLVYLAQYLPSSLHEYMFCSFPSSSICFCPWSITFSSMLVLCLEKLDHAAECKLQ